MSKLLKKLMAAELEKSFRGLDSFVLFDYTGMKAEEAKELRNECRKKQITIKAVKNKIACRVFSQENLEDLDEFFQGPTALVYGGETPVDIAKILIEWRKKHPRFNIKGGYLGGQKLSVKQVEALSKIPSKEVLLSMLAAALMAPAQKFATVLQAPVQNLSYAFNALSEGMENAGVQKAQDYPNC